ETSDLVTEQGILGRTERHIPLDRVQEISIEQGVLHRIFGVVDAKIETAGGQGAEATLSVLSRAEAERLRQAVLARAAALKDPLVKKDALTKEAASEAELTPGPVTQPERRVIRRLSIGDLVVAGATSNHLLSALVLVGTLWAFVDDILPESIYKRAADAVADATGRLLEQDAATAVLVTLVLVVLILAVSVLFSLIGSVALFYGFTFSTTGEDLHRSYGLLTQRSSSLPRHRIQVLEIEQKLLRRLFGLATLRADTVGGHSDESEERNRGRDVLIPVVKRDEVEGLLPVFFPDLEPAPEAWQRVSPLAVRRGTFQGGVVCLLITVATLYYQGSAWGLWPLALLPFIYWANLVRYRNLGYWLGDRYFRTRRGWLGRSIHIVPIRKSQVVEIHQSIFDKRLGLASLIVDTAGQAFTGGGPQITNLPVDEAYQVARTLARRAAATEYKL
ncbi:MAG TPA: PH domain-containing protein, partial [Blastocatellia bacterium]|nr:PH domain-containing protein [Blastocatellia bacterium]